MEEIFTIRMATPEDTALVALHRRWMFADIRHYEPEALDIMEEQFRAWVKDKLEKDEYKGWFAVNSEQQVVAGAGLWLRPWVADPRNLSELEGHIINVYVCPEYRRQGLARRVMEAMVAWCDEQGHVFLSLDASPAALHLYETLGFEVYPRRMNRYHFPAR